MNDKPLPDFRCMVCPNEFALMPLYVVPCDICNIRACGFECLKSHRKSCFPVMKDYLTSTHKRVMKLW